MNHADSGLANGTDGSPQGSFENDEMSKKAKENKEKVEKLVTDDKELNLNTTAEHDEEEIIYNSANSKSVGMVTKIEKLENVHSMPISGTPNSVIQNIRNNKIENERYFDENGTPYLDIDYTDHGNPKMHPFVPHEHKISFENGKINREKAGRKIQK